MAAFFNFTGALFGGAVASTIGKGLVDTEVVTMTTVLCAVVAAFSWNIATWFFGLPSSSSQALIGGLCGAALGAAKTDWSVIKWNEGVAEGCPAYDRVADCRLRVRRALHVFVAYRRASFHAALCSFAIWKTANLQRGLDGP